MAENNLDGIRRYEDLIKKIQETADQALALALAGSIDDVNIVLPISKGGTGSDVKIFVDTISNQFEIDGFKIFRNSIGFQNKTDIVNSGELAGNIRLISCDAAGQDIGPQMRFSGKSVDGSDTVFAFATIAGRKESSDTTETSNDRAGYLQFATTNIDGTILEYARIDSEGTFGIGTEITEKGLGNRVHVSGGDVFLDNVGGTRSIKIQTGESYGRIQAIESLEDEDTEHLFLSSNVRFAPQDGTIGYTCFLDSTTSLGSAAIEIRSDGSATDAGGFVRFYTGAPAECPSVRGQFSEIGLDVFGDVFATRSIIAGGVNNVAGGGGNSPTDQDGFITGDNVKYGPGSPEGVVRGPIGAIYGRNSGDPSGSDPPNEANTLWLKVYNDGETTGWLPISVAESEQNFCVQSECPELPLNSSGNETIPTCRIWFDTNRNILFYYDPNVIRGTDLLARGAWLSVDTYQANVEVTGRSHTQQFRGQIDKDYEYLTTVHFNRQQLNMFLVDMTAAIRQANNGTDVDSNYYTFDLVTLRRRQGNPSATKSTRQEWPGDRQAFENNKDVLRGDGHTLHPTLRTDLIRLSSSTPDGPPVDGTGSVSSSSTNRRKLIDSSQNWTINQWQERENDDVNNNLPANNGYRVTMITGALAGQERTIRSNTSDTLTLRRPWDTVDSVDTPQAGDFYEIVDSQHRKIIARISTKGNVFPNGAHVDPDGDSAADPPPLFEEYAKDDNGVTLTRSQVFRNGSYLSDDVQDFVTDIDNGLESNQPGGDNDDPTNQHLKLDLYIDVLGEDISETGGDEATDAVILAGLWDAVRRPGKIAGVISVTYRLALPPSACTFNAEVV